MAGMGCNIVAIVAFLFILRADDIGQGLETESDKAADTDQWIEQRLNHYDGVDSRMWKQRYFESDVFYRQGGPAFLMVGGETNRGALHINSSELWINIARESGAACFYLEHRFYGKSRPTHDTSVDNLRFLSSQQALEDIATFIQNKTSTFSRKRLDKWILFGGSYSGSLAVWARLKYPHLVHAAVAASPPLFAKLSFHEYLGSVNQTLFVYGGPDCHRAITTANRQVEEMMKTDKGRKDLEKLFNLCENSSMHGNTMLYFHSVLNNHIENVVQYSKGNVIIEKPSIRLSIRDMCGVMNNASTGSEVQRFAHFIQVARKSKNVTECTTIDFAEFVQEVRNTSWEASTYRPWLYQMCSEFGWFQTNMDQPFLTVHSSFPVDICTAVFGPDLTADDVNSAPSRTNLIFGGRSIASILSRIVIFNGGVDPWHVLSYWKSNVRLDKEKVTKPMLHVEIRNVSTQPGGNLVLWEKSDFIDPQGFNSIFVPSSSHCSVFAAHYRNDSIELQNARLAIGVLVNSWLKKL